MKDWEELEKEESLITQLIKNANTNQLSAVVSYFWMLRDKLTAKIKTKIKPLWKVLFELATQNEKTPEFQKIISDLSKWLSLVDEIDDEIFKWLELSAAYVNIDYNTTFFINYLLDYVYKTPREVGEIYLDMLKADIYPDYEKEDIQEIVQTLYKQGQKSSADRICNQYGAKGFDFLENIYAENLQQKNP